jgi:hypothetical protein
MLFSSFKTLMVVNWLLPLLMSLKIPFKINFFKDFGGEFTMKQNILFLLNFYLIIYSLFFMKPDNKLWLSRIPAGYQQELLNRNLLALLCYLAMI